MQAILFIYFKSLIYFSIKSLLCIAIIVYVYFKSDKLVFETKMFIKMKVETPRHCLPECRILMVGESFHLHAVLFTAQRDICPDCHITATETLKDSCPTQLFKLHKHYVFAIFSPVL